MSTPLIARKPPLTLTTGLLYVALLSVSLLAAALVAQHVFAMRPCAWCVFQRVILASITVIASIGALFAYKSKVGVARLFAVLSGILSFCGIVSSAYQDRVANHSFSCDLSFADRFIQSSGLDQAFPWMFGIYASCIEASGTVLGIGLATWAILFFMFLTGLSVIVAIARTNS